MRLNQLGLRGGVVLAHPDREQAIDLFERCEGAGSPDLVDDGLQFGMTPGGRHRPRRIAFRLPMRKIGRAISNETLPEGSLRGRR